MIVVDRTIEGFWWVWPEGHEWPSWYYGEKTAREAFERIANDTPGRKVKIGTCHVVRTAMVRPELVNVDD